MKEFIDIKLTNGCLATISVQQHLIMMHTDFLSAEWPLSGTGILLTPPHYKVINLRFYHTGESGVAYQNFFIDGEYYGAIETFFKSFGFLSVKIKED